MNLSLRDLQRAWNNFFFAPTSPYPIAAYRAMTGFLVLFNCLLLLPDFNAWFGTKGTLPLAQAPTISGGQGFSLFFWFPTDGAAWTLFLLLMASSMLVMIGLFTRVATAVAFVLLVSLHHRNAMMVNSGDYFLRLGLFYLIFSQAGSALSVDHWLRRRKGLGNQEPVLSAPWAQRMIQIQLALLYFSAFVWKVMGETWLNGTAVYYTARLPEFYRFPVPYVFEHLWTIKLWTYGTLLIEFALGILVWIKEFRYWVLLAGMLLHLGIDWSMNIPLFGYIMISAYVTFLDGEDVKKAVDWFRAKLPGSANTGGAPSKAEPSLVRNKSTAA